MNHKNLSQLSVSNVIIHELPQPPETQGVMADEVSPLTPPIRNFFQERITGALAQTGLPVRFLAETASPAPSAIKDFLKGDAANLVPCSKVLATHLFSLTTGVHSPGLLCVASVVVAGKQGAAIIKLEHESGVRARLHGAKGRQRFDIELIDDLMLTTKTRVFKVALFQAGTTNGLAADTQIARMKLVAGYFLTKFLGCELVEKPDLATQRFFESAQEFANERIPDSEERANLEVALLAEMTSNSSLIGLKDFSDRHLDAKRRKDFVSYMQDKEVGAQVQKDTSLIKNRLARVHIRMGAGVSVLAPRTELGASVRVEQREHDTRVEVVGELEKIEGAK